MSWILIFFAKKVSTLGEHNRAHHQQFDLWTTKAYKPESREASDMANFSEKSSTRNPNFELFFMHDFVYR